LLLVVVRAKDKYRGLHHGAKSAPSVEMTNLCEEQERCMGYLLPADYAAFGLAAETADAWVKTASAMMEAFCRRPSLMVTSYTERMRVPVEAQTVRLSYGPLVSVMAVKAKYARPRCEEGEAFAWEVAAAFGLYGAWVSVDVTKLEVSVPTMELRFPTGLLGVRYSEAEVTYTAGVSVVPDALKVACAQIVRNAQATPGLNVKSSKMDTLQTQYFSDALIDSNVQAILRPYVAERLG
jgi:hypothetical protein